MVYVRIELWKHGTKEAKQLLQEMTISNTMIKINDHNEHKYCYNAVLSHSTTYKGKGFNAKEINPDIKDIWKIATIAFDRRRSPAELVYEALKGIFERRKP